MTSPVMQGPALSGAALSGVARTLARSGWELRNLDADLVAGRLVVELHRIDGRWLYLTVDPLGRASVERWHRDPVIRRCFGSGPEFDAHEDRFLGRLRGAPVEMLRAACGYVEDNPAPGWAQLPSGDLLRLLTAPEAVGSASEPAPVPARPRSHRADPSAPGKQRPPG